MCYMNKELCRHQALHDGAARLSEDLRVAVRGKPGLLVQLHRPEPLAHAVLTTCPPRVLRACAVIPPVASTLKGTQSEVIRAAI